MAYSYITKDNIFRVWKQTKEKIDKLTEPFGEYSRIARNLPAENADEDYPNVTDGTSASIIQKTPRRVVQQLPTGLIESADGDTEEWIAVVAQFIYSNKILPYANEDYELFDKCQLIIQSGLTFGNGVSYSPFINHDGEFTPDLTLPYWGDVYPQSGKKSIRSAKYIFIRSWWQKEDVENLIQEEAKRASASKKRNENYDGTWDTEALKKVKDATSDKDEQAKTPHEGELGATADSIELITAFQVGVGGKFYTFNPDEKLIVRTKINPDPRGKMPLDVFYGDIDGENPLGRSIIELIGPLQNLIDSDMQAYQYNRALMLQPPVLKKGTIGNFVFAPGEVLDASNDPNAEIVPLKIDTTAITQYPELYGLQKSQILNLISSPDTSISSEVGNPGFSKTPAGIKQNQANISVDDNAIRKAFEGWFEDWSETAINLYFGQRHGVEKLQLDKKTADKLRELARDGKFDLSSLNENDELLIDYDVTTPVLKFRVDASTSKIADDQTKMQALELVQKFMDSSPSLQQVVPIEKQIAIYNSFVALSGVENPEKLSVDLDEFEKQKQAATQQAQEQSQSQAEPPKPPSVSISFKDLPPAGKIQAAADYGIQLGPEDVGITQDVTDDSSPQLTSDEAHLATQLRQLGFSDEDIQGALQMLENGYSDDQVLQALANKQQAEAQHVA